MSRLFRKTEFPPVKIRHLDADVANIIFTVRVRVSRCRTHLSPRRARADRADDRPNDRDRRRRARASHSHSPSPHRRRRGLVVARHRRPDDTLHSGTITDFDALADPDARADDALGYHARRRRRRRISLHNESFVSSRERLSLQYK